MMYLIFEKLYTESMYLFIKDLHGRESNLIDI